MQRTRSRFGRTGLAVIAVLAMLVQFASAQVAMAAPAPGQTIEICTSHGTEKITVDATPGKQTPAPCNHCEHCAAPALAAEPALSVSVQAVRYAVVAGPAWVNTAPSPYSARGPPRPPGQGPPTA